MDILIHSFIDIITNSSTEIFVAANNNTVKNIKNLVDSLLSISKSELTFDDLFTIELIDQNSYHDYYKETCVSVKPINKDIETKVVSDILSNLTDLFEINAEYNG